MRHYRLNAAIRTSVGHERCRPLHRFGPAIRDYHLLHFVLNGKGRFLTEHGSFTIQKGEGFYIAPGDLTTYVADGSEPWEYLWIGVEDRAEIRETLLRHGLESGVASFTYKDRLGVTQELIQRLQSATPYSYERAMAAFYSLVDTLPLCNEGTTFADQCYRYLENHYFEEIKVEQMARHFNLSRSQFYRLYKSSLKLSPQEGILRFRLEKAKELLERGGVSLTQIAFSCGFCDLSHFSKAYKKLYGQRPHSDKK